MLEVIIAVIYINQVMIPVLNIKSDEKAVLISRKNRFLAEIYINGNIEFAHVHDPGRLKELLYEGNEVLVKRVNSHKRKTKWDIVAAKFEDYWVLVHSGYHDAIAYNMFMNKDIFNFEEMAGIKHNVRYKNSLIDFVISASGKDIFVEVKGCTLLKGNTALFPDAPTLRGRKHLNHLIEIKRYGGESCVLFLVFHRKAEYFSPNYETDPEFYNTLWAAFSCGVGIYCARLIYNSDLIYFDRWIKLKDVKSQGGR